MLGNSAKEKGLSDHSPNDLSALPNYYDLLGVNQDADKTNIREAFFRCKSAFDNVSAVYSLYDKEETSTNLHLISEAYAVLIDDKKRREYDKYLENKHSTFTKKVSYTMDSVLEDPSRAKELEYHDQETREVVNSDEDLSAIKTFRRVLPKVNLRAPNTYDENIRNKISQTLQEKKFRTGQLLCCLREIAGVTREEMFERTKISLEHLNALETDDYEKMPTLTYFKGFIKIYLRYLGVEDIETIVSDYAMEYETWRLTKRNG